MVRIVLALLLSSVALTACGETERRPARSPGVQHAEAEAAASLKSHPQVVEPVAGGTVAAAAPKASEAATPTRRPSSDQRLADDLGATSAAPLDRARALPAGVAIPPLQAPDAVKRIIDAGNLIARTPYRWGGGHGKWVDKGYDCSGSVSYALASAGLLKAPMDSGRLMRWGESGRGRWITVFSSKGHVFLEVAGIRFDTSGTRVTGSRWQNAGRGTAGFVARHWPGL